MAYTFIHIYPVSFRISAKTNAYVARNGTDVDDVILSTHAHTNTLTFSLASQQKLTFSYRPDNHWPLADYALATLNGSVVAPV